MYYGTSLHFSRGAAVDLTLAGPLRFPKKSHRRKNPGLDFLGRVITCILPAKTISWGVPVRLQKCLLGSEEPNDPSIPR